MKLENVTIVKILIVLTVNKTLQKYVWVVLKDTILMKIKLVYLNVMLEIVNNVSKEIPKLVKFVTTTDITMKKKTTVKDVLLDNTKDGMIKSQISVAWIVLKDV